MFDDDILKFRAHVLSAKNIFTIKRVCKNTCYEFVRRYHYLGDAQFMCEYGFGLYYRDEYNTELMVGCATYASPQGTMALKGWFGLDNDCKYVMELTRLCMLPKLNKTNATSFLLGNTLKMLKKYGIRAVVTLADASRHVGSIYQVCNFKYYGLTDKKNNFFSIDGIKNPRGKSRDRHGVWIEKPRKHRYCYLLDKKIKVLYHEEKYPNANTTKTPNCCNGTKKVFDRRFQEWFTCPVCCGYIKLLNDNRNAKSVEIRNANKHNTNRELYLFDYV